MTNNEDKEWFLFHSIGKALKEWLQKPQKKDFIDQLLREAKKKAQENGPEIKEGFDPDFILIDKTKGIFMIDSKNVKTKQADEAFNKAINQCKVFKSILEILFEATLNVNPFDKINFKMGVNLLTPTQRIGLVYSDDVDETTQDELNKEKVKIFKYLKEFNPNILGSIKCYLFEENILIIIACDKINYILIEEFNLDFLATIGRSCEYEFIVEQKYCKILEDQEIDKSKISIRILSYIKKFFNKDIGDSIIFIENKYKKMNIKDKLNLVSDIKVFEVKNSSNIKNEYEPNNIILCFAPPFSIDMTKKRLKDEKKKINTFIKYYTPCEFIALDLADLQNLSEINFYFLNNRFVLFAGKLNGNEFYYDFIDYMEDDFCKYFKKLKESNEIIKTKFYLFHYEFRVHFLTVCEELNIDLLFVNEEMIFKQIYKNSFFYILPCDLQHSFDIFKRFFAFRFIDEINIFIDDIMSSKGIDKLHYSLDKNLANKVKTFLITLDSSQFILSDQENYCLALKNIGFDFEVENLNKVYRCNKKIFDYIKPFYEFSNYLNDEVAADYRQFASFLEFKEFIIKELKDRNKSIDKTKSDSKIKLTDLISRIEMHLPLSEVECANKADGFDIVEIGVFEWELLKTIETAINEAIDKKANMNDILVVINERFDTFDPVNDLNEEEEADLVSLTNIINNIKNEDFDLKTGMVSDDKLLSVFYGFFKKSLREIIKHPNICIDTLKEALKYKNWLIELIPYQLKSKYPICKIIEFKNQSLIEQFTNDVRSLYSSEFKHVIYIVTGTGYSHNNMSSLSRDISEYLRLGHYFFMSRATMNLKIIYVKEGHEN